MFIVYTNKLFLRKFTPWNKPRARRRGARRGKNLKKGRGKKRKEKRPVLAFPRSATYLPLGIQGWENRPLHSFFFSTFHVEHLVGGTNLPPTPPPPPPTIHIFANFQNIYYFYCALFTGFDGFSLSALHPKLKKTVEGSIIMGGQDRTEHRIFHSKYVALIFYVTISAFLLK